MTESLMKSCVPTKPSASSRARNVDGQPREDFQDLRINQLVTTAVLTEKSEGVEKSGDLFRSAVVSPTCTHSSRNSSHGSLVGFAAA